MFQEIFQYRELLKTNVKKEIRGKYKASFLGVLWSFINPLLQVVVYAVVFPYLLKNTGTDYVVYLIAGIIPWTFFSNTLNQCAATIKSNAGIIKKVYFPREILPLSVALSGLVNFFISCLIILFFCLVFGTGISWHLVFVPVIASIQTIMSLGIGLILSAITPYLQDLEYIVNFLLMLAFYGSPIIYKLDQFNMSSLLAKMIKSNPVTMLIQSYRDCFLYHKIPNFGDLGICLALGLFIITIGIYLFRRLERGFAEQL